jgi:hypothetical protein
MPGPAKNPVKSHEATGHLSELKHEDAVTPLLKCPHLQSQDLWPVANH